MECTCRGKWPKLLISFDRLYMKRFKLHMCDLKEVLVKEIRR